MIIKKVAIILISLYFTFCSVDNTFAKLNIIYPNIDGIGAVSIGYSVLKLALEKSEGPFELVVNKPEVNQKRARKEVSEGILSLFDTGFDPNLEDKFDPIYLPIDRGILGWRLFIIHKDNEILFSTIKSINDLNKKMAGQGTGWGDIAILNNAGIKVKTAPKIKLLINMIGKKRFDFFPLGANEVYSFLEKYRNNDTNLVVEKNIVLIYPYGRFFYVKKGNTKLAKIIKGGMEKSLADGSLQELLKDHKFFKDAFSKAKLKERVQIRIDTPNLTDSFKSIDKKWWYRP